MNLPNMVCCFYSSAHIAANLQPTTGVNQYRSDGSIPFAGAVLLLTAMSQTEPILCDALFLSGTAQADTQP